MKIAVVLMVLMAGISTALPVVISPNYTEARDIEDTVAKRDPVFPNSLRSVDFPRDAVDEFNKRNGVEGNRGSGGSFKREPNGTQGNRGSGGSFKREPNGTQGNRGSGGSFKREPNGTQGNRGSGGSF